MKNEILAIGSGFRTSILQIVFMSWLMCPYFGRVPPHFICNVYYILIGANLSMILDLLRKFYKRKEEIKELQKEETNQISLYE